MKYFYMIIAVSSIALFSSCGFNSYDDVYETQRNSDRTIFDENGYPVYQQGDIIVLDRNRRTNRRTRTSGNNGGYSGCPGEQPQSRPRLPQQRPQPQTKPRPRPQPQSTPRPRPQPQQQNARPAPSNNKTNNLLSRSFGKVKNF